MDILNWLLTRSNSSGKKLRLRQAAAEADAAGSTAPCGAHAVIMPRLRRKIDRDISFKFIWFKFIWPPPLFPFVRNWVQGLDRKRAFCRAEDPTDFSCLGSSPQLEALIILPCGSWLALHVEAVTIGPVSKWNWRSFSFRSHRFF